MKHVNKTLNDLDREALDAAYALQGAMNGLRMEEGGDDDDDDDDDDEEEEDEDEDEEEDDDDDEGSGDLSKAEFDRVRAALKKANNEAKKYRLEAKKLRKSNESETERAIREAKEEASKETEDRYKGMLVRTAFRSKLVEAGLTSGVDRLAKMLDMEEVEVDEDGDIEGLDTQVKDLKKEFPELFNGKKRVSGKGDVGDRRPSDKKQSSAERIASMARGE